MVAVCQSKAQSVSIPSNRGVLSDKIYRAERMMNDSCLNPLKSGRPVGLKNASDADIARAKCLNPLKSGRPVGHRNGHGKVERDRQVSIPSNRGVLSDKSFLGCPQCPRPGLNPLKSGRPVGPKVIQDILETLRIVSIPSNRGVLSDLDVVAAHNMEEAMSQSPQIGASCRTNIPLCRVFV